jgi:hypothetical protein
LTTVASLSSTSTTWRSTRGCTRARSRFNVIVVLNDSVTPVRLI